MRISVADCCRFSQHGCQKLFVADSWAMALPKSLPPSLRGKRAEAIRSNSGLDDVRCNSRLSSGSLGASPCLGVDWFNDLMQWFGFQDFLTNTATRAATLPKCRIGGNTSKPLDRVSHRMFPGLATKTASNNKRETWSFHDGVLIGEL